ncbi:MAG TPA: hypothetical protein PK185_17345 [Cyclobacteriaceae bacterium]|nr:hypothetical protein [Cyclobacteriaceae bacterium]HRK55684.1 hypothetical protein [Cyclobacteriaceae bacterium]
MLTILRANRREKYIGVIGGYMEEVLYHDKILAEVLKKVKRTINPPVGSRLSGPSKFMILRAFSNDAVIVIATRKMDNPKNTKCKLVMMVNKSDVPTSKLLAEARLLAKFRWGDVMF